eukprot:CAMPEP_0115834782 /NCGR_PEP_ID=MMETSP0287-20121206/3860_1 /TAXON_ID=412157 /ORGANISM="Chrysochromulina rotalis, Strain UIO044" /LENGTH=242 /DNA_ID=CAMNT_0003288227 /DNA_START=359 /DNA_END=1084 /DNA_ORIENTATION=-
MVPDPVTADLYIFCTTHIDMSYGPLIVAMPSPTPPSLPGSPSSPPLPPPLPSLPLPPGLPPSPATPPPPASPPPPPPPDATIAFEWKVMGDLADFTAAVTAQVEVTIADVAVVEPSAVTVTAMAGSVILHVEIIVPQAQAESTQNSLAVQLATPEAATALMSTLTTSQGSAIVVTEATVPSILTPPIQKDDVAIIIAIVVASLILAGALACVLYCMCVGSYLCATQPCVESCMEKRARGERW